MYDKKSSCGCQKSAVKNAVTMFQVLQDGIIMPVYFTNDKCMLQISYVN